ncbi:MAG: TlpA family protein disulfide reductase [Treponema sp.]|jgi:thiol-disulfide isomerase/thioredoxin|nr:TlpA family protein disulfide reductase [Treponema sp.]
MNQIRNRTRNQTGNQTRNRTRCAPFFTAVFFALLLGAALSAGAQAAANGAPAPGKPAPDFTFTAPDGRTVKLSDYRGKPLALHFWATWCGPCIRELPLMANLTASKSGDLVTLAVNCSETDREVTSFLGSRKLSLNVVMDRDGQISRLYNIFAIPQTFMIDGEGIIRSIKLGAYSQRELSRDISSLLNP